MKIRDVCEKKNVVGLDRVLEFREKFFWRPLREDFLFVDVVDVSHFRKSPFKSFGLYVAEKLKLISVAEYIMFLLSSYAKEFAEGEPVVGFPEFDEDIISEVERLERELKSLKGEKVYTFEKNTEGFIEYRSLLNDLNEISQRLKNVSDMKEKRVLEKRKDILLREKAFYEKVVLLKRKIPKVVEITPDFTRLEKTLNELKERLYYVLEKLRQTKRVSRKEEQVRKDLISSLKVEEDLPNLSCFVEKDLGTLDRMEMEYIVDEVFKIKRVFGLKFDFVLLNDFPTILERENVFNCVR